METIGITFKKRIKKMECAENPVKRVGYSIHLKKTLRSTGKPYYNYGTFRKNI